MGFYQVELQHLHSVCGVSGNESTSSHHRRSSPLAYSNASRLELTQNLRWVRQDFPVLSGAVITERSESNPGQLFLSVPSRFHTAATRMLSHLAPCCGYIQSNVVPASPNMSSDLLRRSGVMCAACGYEYIIHRRMHSSLWNLSIIDSALPNVEMVSGLSISVTHCCEWESAFEHLGVYTCVWKTQNKKRETTWKRLENDS